MTKSELFKRFWIPIRKRIPPEDETIDVLVWNYAWERPLIQQSNLAHYTAQAILDDAVMNIAEDRLFSHWMIVEGP